jgi:hypothetical protein
MGADGAFTIAGTPSAFVPVRTSVRVLRNTRPVRVIAAGTDTSGRL